MEFYETSAKDKDKVDEAFFALTRSPPLPPGLRWARTGLPTLTPPDMLPPPCLVPAVCVEQGHQETTRGALGAGEAEHELGAAVVGKAQGGQEERLRLLGATAQTSADSELWKGSRGVLETERGSVAEG
jgi:hypothetical protein